MDRELLKKEILKVIEHYKSNYITTRTILHKLNIEPHVKREAKKMIRELVREGILLKFKKNYYGISKKFNVVTGKIDITREGYGFLIPNPEFNLEEDIFISRKNIGNSFHNDIVSVQIFKNISKSRKKFRKKKLEGKVVQVIDRFSGNLICEIVKTGKKTLAKPIDERFKYVFVVKNIKEKVKLGEIVEVKFLTPPEKNSRPTGEIVEILGGKTSREVEYKIIMKKYGIESNFPDIVLKEAEKVAIKPDEKILKSRKNYTSHKIVTIDGEDAKDFDDAVEVKRLKNGNYLLGVHIADVSHYVKPDTKLDLEAYKRGTSTYFPDRAIPMLPESLSNEICSLKPGEIRLTFSVILEINLKGKIERKDIHLSYIKSYRRMTYTEVQKILEGDENYIKKYQELVPQFLLMKELGEILYKARKKRGAIDFDLPEEKFEFEREKIIGIYKADRFISHRIIEEFMIAANVAVANYLSEKGYPLLYRIHEPPDSKKVLDFLEFIKYFGFNFKLKLEKLTPKDFQKISTELSTSPIGDFLLYQMLRTFKLAIYSDKNAGHFGLSLKNYTHFTSPIRRYADLINHRILKKAIKGGKKPKLELNKIAKYISEREKKSTDAERETIKYEKCKFMEEKMGEDFEGYVSFVRENGFYVELIKFFVEGFVPIYTLKGYFIFNEKKQQLKAETGKLKFSPGDKVLIKVVGIDVASLKIEFQLIKKLNQ